MEVTYADGRVPCPFPALRAILAVCLLHDPVRLPMMVTDAWRASGWQLPSIHDGVPFPEMMTRVALHRSNLNQKGHTTVDGSDDGPVVEEPCPGGRHGRKEEGEQKDATSKANCESGVATE